MLDISVIILTYNEELHIKRCLDNVSPFAKEIVIIDSFSTDRTLEIARGYPNVQIIQNKWENNHAKQFNWGLDHCKISSEWILRLDADEYLLPELIDELSAKLPIIPNTINGLVIKRRHIFLGKWMKHGTYPVKLLRIFRNGKGRCESRLMDEHIQLNNGGIAELENDFCDHNLNNISWFCHKHINYAIREAAELLDFEFGLTQKISIDNNNQISSQAIAKRKAKYKYAKQPLFFRSFAYFCYRYFFKGAFWEGREGFLWSFIQGWWYRTLVDAKIYEIKWKCGNNPTRIKLLLQDEYNIKL